MMERLTIDEIIEHCKRKTEKYEYLNGANTLENANISLSFIKEYWEHWQVKEYLEELKQYRDLEEWGMLLRLPCKVGSTVYAICTCEAVGTVLDGILYGSNGGFGTATGYYCPYELSDKCPHIDIDDCDECKNVESVFEDTFDYINITEYEVIIGLKHTNLCVTIDKIGKTVFLAKSRSRAEVKRNEK